ncbi:MAG: cell division protein FtsL [Gammaproteobacteria bacterium]|nr:cell division protein FtsL [Gammaproteobacteria bacterium]
MSAKKTTAKGKSVWLPSSMWWVFWVFLLVSVSVTGFLVLNQVRDYQRLDVQLEQLRVQQEELLSEFTRLQIERGSEASLERVVNVATSDMGMKFPTEVVTVKTDGEE